MNNPNPFFLNPEVEADCKADFALFSLFVASFHGFSSDSVNPCRYDPDIDPLHNPDYVENRKKKERLHVDLCKKRIDRLRQAW